MLSFPIYRVTIETEDGLVTRETRILFEDFGTTTVQRPSWAGNDSMQSKI